ncbi:MAG: MaoC family dehydratase [Hyphomonadaceae bacterium]|nr:MaoC family dehydratase [Hyphomonadaceae bacterium]
MSLEARTLYFEDLSLGLSETYRKQITSTDIVAFAEISGDRNPIHLSEEFAATTPFGVRIAHGILTASFISAVIGMRLPGPGSVYIAQNLRFLAPVRIGDEVVTTVEVVELTEKGRRAKLKCECRVGDTRVLEGEAEVKVPARPAG